MTTQELHERLRVRFGDDVGPLSEPRADPSCPVRPGRLVELCRFAKAEPGLELDFLEDLTAVDWPKKNAIELVYHLFSFRHRHGIVLKVEVDRAAPRIATVESVWKAANWFEREVYDLFGVEFEGHPDLRRLLLPDDWVGHPLRKDYQEAGGYHGISNVRENPLVELRRLDERARAAAAPPPAAAPPAAPPAAAPAAPAPKP
jgi:NADH-quinone oxidoreductase subunit C